jgi:hypothetical protein
MRKLAVVALLTAALSAVGMGTAWAGSPHFVTATASVSGNTLTVTGTEAGLGNETQVHIVVTATANCVNGGNNHPKATNKTGVAASGDFPVQNGHADFRLTATASFQPSCTPPMTVTFSPITLTDTTHGVTKQL